MKIVVTCLLCLTLAAAPTELRGQVSGANEGSAKTAAASGKKLPPLRSGTVAWQGAAIETMGPQGRIENATLLATDGKIVAVGADVDIPETAERVDVRGRTILPGFVEPYYAVNIASGSSETQSRIVIVRGRAFRATPRGSTSVAFTKVADSFYPFGTNYRPLSRIGITSANLVARGYGQSATARITPGLPQQMLENGDGQLFATVTNSSTSLNVLRSNLAQVARSRGRVTSSTSSTARRGGPSRSSRSASSGRGRGGGKRDGPPSATRSAAAATATPQVTAALSESMKLWSAVYDGKAPLVVNVNNAAAVLHLLKALKPYKDVKLALVVSGSSLYYNLASLRARGNVTLIVTPSIDRIPNTANRINMVARAHRAGLPVALSLASDRNLALRQQDTPLFAVAQLVRTGLPRQEAFEALTINPAKMLNLQNTRGSLEVGKLANLLVFDGDPLDPQSQLLQTVVEGRICNENSN